MNKNQERKKKQYVVHKLRSHPFRCITLPIVCGVIFILYWFILCPLLYVFGRNQHGPFIFWLLALFVFITLIMIVVCFWRCSQDQEILPKQQQKSKQLNNIQELYHVKLSDSTKLPESETLFSKCSVKRKPEPLQTINLKEKEEEKQQEEQQEAVSAKSPMTPRELFFIDLIQAANESPLAMIPATQTFLDAEQRHYVGGEMDPERNSEYFIANVSNRRSLTSEMYMYIDNSGQIGKQ